MKVAFVTNICAHYRVKTFEALARLYDVQYFFYSAGDEWYWQQNHGVRAGDFPYAYLPGFQLTQAVRVAPSLVTKLWRGHYDVFVKCINGRFALPVTYLIARLLGRPFVLWTGIWMSLQTPFHRLAFPVTVWIYRHADAIAVYGEHVKRYLIGLGVAPEKIFVAPHAVDNVTYNQPVAEPDKAPLRAKLALGDRKVVLYLGRLEAVKGVDYLIRAFARLNHQDAVLVVVGEGALRERLELLAWELGIQENVRFLGYVPPERTRIYFAMADVYVLPSVTMPTGKETWGLTVNEAMNQGVPVVASEAVGAAAGGLVQSGVNGFVVPERDSAALAQAIHRILTNVKLREQLSQNARRIIAEWDNERMVQGFRRAIESVVKQDSHFPTDRHNTHAEP
ncbi:MAG TPA: glycosyltransferase family 4 protein [Alphaproteobacteria bacterium]|nr:glycosyltransferase family 4 protein [Alphaproteobacteria bacterium]